MLQHNTLYLCDITPCTHIPLTREQFFWYTSTEYLSPGTVVLVPLFRRMVRGVVLSCRTDMHRAGGMKLKKITRVVTPAYFTDIQRALITYTANNTGTSHGVVYDHCVITPTQERGSGNHIPSFAASPIPSQMHDSCAAHAAHILAQGSSHTVFRDTATTARDALYSALWELLYTKERHLCIITPDILSAEILACQMRTLQKDAPLYVLHAKVSKGRQWSAATAARATAPALFIGTRKTIFLPFSQLGCIVIDDAHDIGFKQWDRAPRYDVRTVAEYARTHYACPLVSVSAAPRITRIVPTPIAPPRYNSPVTIVDLHAAHTTTDSNNKKQRRTKKGTRMTVTLSEPLCNAIQDALSAKKQTILFYNHKGMSAFSLCATCQALLACPHCNRALIGVAEGNYECLHCTYKTDTFPTCAECGGMTFRTFGSGTQRIAQTVAHRFPSARIARIDGHSMRDTHAATRIIQAFAQGEIDIIIGTQMALRDWRIPNLRIIGILDADALLAIPDFTADERVFGFITTAAAAVTHDLESGHVYVQTYHPQYKTFLAAATADYDHFRRAHLADRKMLAYPPYWRIIAVTCQHKDAATASDLAQKFAQSCRSHAPQETCRIDDPYVPLLGRHRGYYRSTVIIRIKNHAAPDSLPSWLLTQYAMAPAHTIIDCDPIALP